MSDPSDSSAGAPKGAIVAGYPYADTGESMAEYLKRELAWRKAHGLDTPAPAPPARRAASPVITDYPWLRSGRVEAPVEPLRLRNRR